MSTYRGLIMLFAAAAILLGVTIFVITASHGGGVGLLLGPLFVAAGLGRIYLLRRSRG